ncbi:MAG: transposase [Alphaproteobacteria bacterium]|nr:transposase [Alphaproteobacteria bacterium]
MLPLASARGVPSIPAALPDAPRRRPSGSPAGILQRAQRTASPRGVYRTARAAQGKLVRLCQAALRQAQGSARLSRRYTHGVAISNSRLIALDARGVTFRYKD